MVHTTRRSLLAGTAGTALLGTIGIGATRPTSLPDVLTDEATKHYPTPPEVQSIWQATVTEAHAREAVDLLAETVETGERLWDAADPDDERWTGAGGWLENAREAMANGNYAEALFDARHGIGFAAEDLGRARAWLDRPAAEPDRLRARGRSNRERLQAVRSATRPYSVAEPGVDLAWYYRIERELARARRSLRWLDDESFWDEGSKADAVAQLERRLRGSELQVRAAERFYDLLRDRLDDRETTAHAGHLRRTIDGLRSDIESLPSRRAVRREYLGENGVGESVTPYEFAHSRLVRRCFDRDFAAFADVERDLRVLRAVRLSTALATRRAHEFAVDRLVVEPDDTGFDSGHTLAEKRRARATYRRVVGSDPPPLLTRLAARAIEDLQVAVVGFADSYRDPIWQERLDAYLYALLGRAKLRAFPPVYERVAGESLKTTGA